VEPPISTALQVAQWQATAAAGQSWKAADQEGSIFRVLLKRKSGVGGTGGSNW